jgi:hypothetical protein
MKIFKSFFLVFMLFVFIGCKQTEDNSNESKIDNVETGTAEREVAAAVEILNNAIINPEKSVLESITADEVTYGHSSGLVQNKEEFIDDLINGDFDFSSVNVSNQSIHIKDETAVVRQIFSAEATNAGDPIDIRIGNVLVYVKQNSQWKLLARQAFRL